jgi:DNA (cytosine-5)-methyltransferase 1
MAKKVLNTLTNSAPAKIFSFFSGAGFLDLGFETSGFDVVYASELSPDFTKAYIHSRECLQLPLPEYGCNTGENGDIEALLLQRGKHSLDELVKSAKKSGSLIGFIGGPPCPDFSVGGKNRGREGDNGKLSGSYVELICQQQPDFFVFENVKGLWSTKQHRAFYEELKYRLVRSGYVLADRLINAIEYGAPQDRDRIILMGFHKKLILDDGVTKITRHFMPEEAFPWQTKLKFPRNEVFSYSWPTTECFHEHSVRSCPKGLPKELTVQYWFEQNDVVNHPNAEHCFKPRQGLQRFQSVLEGDDSRKSFKRLHRWRYSPTVCYGNNEVHLHPYEVRRISVSEALSLQSLPKGFSLPPDMSLTKMFKTVGNGVPYQTSCGIAAIIGEFLAHPAYYYQSIAHEQLELLPIVA